MQALKEMLTSYLKGATLILDFTGLFFPKHRPLPPKPPVQTVLINDYLAICGDMQRAFARLECYYEKVES
jgi:hypothetical protein